jgi:hypothetical protein
MSINPKRIAKLITEDPDVPDSDYDGLEDDDQFAEDSQLVNSLDTEQLLTSIAHHLNIPELKVLELAGIEPDVYDDGELDLSNSSYELFVWISTSSYMYHFEGPHDSWGTMEIINDVTVENDNPVGHAIDRAIEEVAE